MALNFKETETKLTQLCEEDSSNPEIYQLIHDLTFNYLFNVLKPGSNKYDYEMIAYDVATDIFLRLQKGAKIEYWTNYVTDTMKLIRSKEKEYKNLKDSGKYKEADLIWWENEESVKKQSYYFANLCGYSANLHNFSEGFVKNNMSFEKTSPTHNGIALFFHEDSGKLQLIDMEKVRAAHFEQNMPRKTPDTFIEPSDIKIARLEQLQSTAPDVSIEPHRLNNISQRNEKSSGNELLRQKQKSLENTKTKKNRRNGDFGFNFY